MHDYFAHFRLQFVLRRGSYLEACFRSENEQMKMKQFYIFLEIV